MVGSLGEFWWPAIRRIMFATALCALGGWFIAWGLLNAGRASQAALGATLGLVSGGLSSLKEAASVQGRSQNAERYGRGLSFLITALLLAIIVLSLVQLYNTGLFCFPIQDRVVGFERLWRAMDEIYPYFELKGVDWDGIHDCYLPLVEAAQSDEQYFSTIEAMLTELNDSHTYLVSPRLGPRGYFATTQEIDGQAVVKEGGTGIAREAGLEAGSVVLAVDGGTVEQSLPLVYPALQSCSTPWCRRRRAFLYLLSVPSDGVMVVDFEAPTGELRTATLVWPGSPLAELPESDVPVLTSTNAQSPTLSSSYTRTSDYDPWRLPPPLICGERLSSGLGLIRVPTFEEGPGHSLVTEFDAALDQLLDAPGLILDLRGNSGGSTRISDRVAGRFLDESFTYGREFYRVRLPQRGWLQSRACRIRPRSPVYIDPVVVLIDSSTMSAAEHFLVALVDSGRVRTVGRRTGGAISSSLFFRLPGGGVAQFSASYFRRNDGTPLEGEGIRPDLAVSWTINDLRQGRDPDVEAAERMILGSLDSSP